MPFLIGYAAFNFTTALSEIVIGAFALFSHPRTERKRALAFWMFCLGLWSFGVAMHAINDGNPAKAMLWSQLLHLGAIPIPVAFLDLAMTLAGKRNKKVLWALYGISVVYLAFLFTPWMVKSVQPIGPFLNFPRAGILYNLYVAQFVGCVMAALVFLGWRLANSVGKEREQLRFIFYGSLIAYSTGPTAFLYMYNLPIFPFGTPLVVLNSLIIAYAILHHQLLDIRLLLRETALNVFTGSVLAGATLVIALPLLEFQAMAAVFVGVILMALLMAVAYNPIRKAIQPAIDRIIFSNRFAYLEELSQLPNDMLEFTNLREMLTFLLTRLKEAARLDRVRILMYDPGHQSYEETVIRSDNEKSDPNHQLANLSETSGLIQFLKDDRNLWMADDLARLHNSNAENALAELKSLSGAACFPVCKGNDVMGVVILGAKSSKESFNQQDMKILRALRMRLENFFAQAMTITQEALNMVKDSHDMKNDVNVLKGRVTWRAMRIAGWKIEFEKNMKALNEWLATEEAKGVQGPEREQVKQVVTGMRTQALEWFGEAEKSRTVEEQTIQRLAHRLRNWAEYGRVVSEGFRGQRQMESIEIAAAIQIAVERWRPIAERKTLALSTAGTPMGLRIWGERTLLEQIIENLIDNAVKATSQGTIVVSGHKDGHNVVIEVKDSGCGIPAADLGTIFEKPFYQGKGRESLEQSTGVGLYLVAQYAKSLGGKVSAESQEGKGSTFRVVLPLHQEQTKKAGVAA